jgi:exodeoxyribonuclease VIII
MDNAAYHAHPAVSKSHLDLLARSPLHYWARYIDPKRELPDPTPAMRIGTALHTLVLEQDQFEERYITAPQVDRRTKAGKEAWAEFETEAGDLELIAADDRAQISRMAEAVWAHPAAAALLHWEGKAETTHMWTDEATGLACKCRPDWLTNDGRLIVDLKTTENASPREFGRSIAQWRYHVQAAWYLDGIEQSTGTRPEQFLFVTVEKRAPFACAVYAADAEMIAAGAQTAARDLEVLATCKAADAWPGYSDQIEPISLPAWMRPNADGTAMGQPPEIEMY